MKMSRIRRDFGFVLLEAMLAVVIFALATLTLGRAMENCIKGERFRREEVLAQRALSNYFLQIESGAMPIGDKVEENLKGAWQGMKMRITRTPLRLKNENEQELFDLFEVQLQLSWESAGEMIQRDMNFIIYNRPR